MVANTSMLLVYPLPPLGQSPAFEHLLFLVKDKQKQIPRFAPPSKVCGFRFRIHQKARTFTKAEVRATLLVSGGQEDVELQGATIRPPLLSRIIVQIRSQPALHHLQFHAFAQVIVLHLVASDLADGKVP